MRVGTDGVLIGAWCSAEGKHNVLDVGTGTGVIALMVAQRSPFAVVDAVEIDEESFEEASQNFAISPWQDRLLAVKADFREYVHGCAKSYDLIVSNPPFFTNGALPPDSGRKAARHCTSLTFVDLLRGAEQLLTDDGRVAIVTPADAERQIEAAVIECDLRTVRKTYVFSKPESQPRRILWEMMRSTLLCRESGDNESALVEDKYPRPVVDRLTIAESSGAYTPQYRSLTSPYYLFM